MNYIEKLALSEKEVISILNKVSESTRFKFYEIIDKVIDKLSLNANDDRFVFSCRDKERLVLIMGQRYVFDIRGNNKNTFGFISNHKTNLTEQEQYNGNPIAFYNRTDDFILIDVNNLTESINSEIKRSNKSGYLKYDNVSLRKSCFDKDYRNEILSKTKNAFMKNIKLYDIHGSSTIENYRTLITPDDKYFFWDSRRFTKNEIGDIVFWVNRTEREVIYTVIDSKDIRPSFNNGKNIINDLGYDVSATAQDATQFENFYRFKIVKKAQIPDGWNYSNLVPFNGQTMAIILYEPNVNEPEKKIDKINDLKKIFSKSIDVLEILNQALMLLEQNKYKKSPSVWFVTQGATFRKESGMKFLWAPEKGKDGSGRFFWDNILKVKKGDIIFNYSEGELKGISLASNDGYKAVNKDAQSPWSPNGYRVDIDLILLDPSINSEIFKRNISSFNTHLAQIYNKPFSANGSINQGYLYEFSKEAGRYIRDIYNKPFGNKVIDEFFDNVKLNKKDINIFEVCDISILTAIKTKPFILLAGISGTGKSRLVRTLAYKTCSKKELRNDPRKPGNYELIPVRPNWHDSSELLGYVSRINGEKYITTTFMKFIAKAWKHTDIPFFLCLDEMNLAPVEQYFAEYLSIIETRQEKNGELVTDFIISKNNFENPNLYTNLLTDLELSGSEFDEGISIPGNLIVIGTVNMDETTHSFSRKVLDRAMTFEMNNVDLTAGLELFESDWSYPNSYIASDDVIGKYTSGAEVYSQIFKEKDEVIGFLNNINKELDGTPFKIAYRVRDEFLIYCFYASKYTTADWLTKALDEMTSMKILSRIEGDETKTGMVLTNLQRIITPDFKKSNAKIKEMETRLQANGYTSFWS